MKQLDAKTAIDHVREQLKAVREAVAAIEFKLSELEAALRSQVQAPARGGRSTGRSRMPARRPRSARPRPRNGPRSSGSFAAAGEQTHGSRWPYPDKIAPALQTRCGAETF